MKKEIPILFSTPMVEAILVGRKKMTRRILKVKGCKPFIPDNTWDIDTISKWNKDYHPYGKVGDILWVREKWENETSNGKRVNFYAGNVEVAHNLAYRRLTKWKPSIHMPKTAARIWLEITNIRVERLQDISENDAIAEGIFAEPGRVSKTTWYKKYLNESEARIQGLFTESATECFKTLWESINGEDSWNINPWVWIIEFKKITR